jgi:carbamoyl-phosphate synthase large subunit
MPRRTDVKKVLIIGSGPIVIGQACEFDYSGTQACKALRALGYRIVLVNSNPATIMTDPEMADRTYIEPLTLETLTRIIEKERPDALLPNLGGQTGLNLSSELAEAGVLDKYGVRIIGVDIEAIKRGEDRTEFKNTMASLGIETPRSTAVNTIEAAEEVASQLGYPVVIRPAYTMGGTGGGIVYNVEELRVIVGRGLAASLVHQVLVEESVLGWEELELEVVRDADGKMITVCFIENVDPMGVHTGDSFCTAPMLTIAEDVQRTLQEYSYRIVDAIGVIGGTNVQFARNPETGRIVIIEINPRTSRSSALASKAIGFPIALVSARLAAGITLSEIPYWRDGTLDRYAPGGDYVVVKFPRWAFEKFPGALDRLGTQMRAVGEVMSIGKTYKEAFQKAIRSLEIGRYGLGFAKDFHARTLSELMTMLSEPTSERQFIMYEALRKGASVEELAAKTFIKPWFIEQMKELVELEEELLRYKGREIPPELLVRAKKDGFSDRYLATILGMSEAMIRERRVAAGAVQTWQAVPVSGVEDGANYYYSTYNGSSDEVPVSERKKVMILGGGPNRIGQGIEFDYCCVHAAFAARELGYETVMVNCNPETVSTDYDTSDRLYFEPLTVEDVLGIYRKENPVGVVVQLGGQTPLNISDELEREGVKILGTTPDTIDLAEDRDRFEAIMRKLEIPMPESGMASTMEEAVAVAGRIGYPLIVRPSYVLGGRGMMIVHEERMLAAYMKNAKGVSPERPILIDRFLEHATEAEADALSDGTDVFVPSIMEHVEYAGIHSGDSACVLPPVSIPERHRSVITDYTVRIAQALGVVGLLNIQFAITNGTVYVLEANPRASRTVPLVSKVFGLPLVKAAVRLMLGERLSALGLKAPAVSHFGVKESVFPFSMLPEVDPLLGPEMRSTGEVLGLADSFGLAFFKAEDGAGQRLPCKGSVLISVSRRDRPALLEAAVGFRDLGFRILATEGTRRFLSENGVESELVLKMHEGRPHIVDRIKNGEVQLLINTPAGKESEYDDSTIRKNAIKYRVPYITTIPAAVAAAKGIAAKVVGEAEVKSLQEYQRIV